MDIERLYFQRLEEARFQGKFDESFFSAVEMLPAGTRASEAKAGSALPSKTAPALTGAFISNQLKKVPRFVGGFDGGTVVNYFGRFENCGYSETFLDLLSEWRDVAQEYADRDEEYYQKFENQTFLVLPYGSSSSSVKFKYMIRWRGFTILFRSGRYCPDKPAVQVDFSYEVLREKDLFDARLEVEDFLFSLGFRCDKVTFQRIDLNVTLNLDFDLFSSAYNEGRFLSRLRSFNRWEDNTSEGMRTNYIRGGGKDAEAQIRIYDKYHELQKTQNEEKKDDLRGVLGEDRNLTRVEFSLKSGFFRTCGVKTFEDLERELPAIISYLVSDWFRILSDKKKRGQENKQDLDQCWLAVQYAFYCVFIQGDDVKPIQRKQRRNLNKKRLWRQAVGCVTSALALSLDAIPDINEFGVQVFEYLQTYKRLVFRSYKKKRRLYEATILRPVFDL